MSEDKRPPLCHLPRNEPPRSLIPISGIVFKHISKEMNLTLYFSRLLWPSITLTADLHLLKYVCSEARQSTLTDPGAAQLSDPVKVPLLCGARVPGTISVTAVISSDSSISPRMSFLDRKWSDGAWQWGWRIRMAGRA